MTRWTWALLIVLYLTAPLGAFEPPPLREACNRTENPLAHGWLGTFDPDFIVNLTANGSVCLAATNGNAAAYWGTALSADMSIAVKASDAITTAAHTINLIVRLQQPSAVNQTADYYRCTWAPNSGTMRIDEVANGGSGVTLAGPLTLPTTTGDELGCSIIGETITLWHKPVSTGVWTPELSAVDASVTGAGYVGLHLSTSQVSVDNIRFAAMASLRVGLHTTQAEAGVWQARQVSGPYQDEWFRIVASADAFVASGLDVWPGNALNAAWDGDDVRDGLQPPNTYPDGSDGDDRSIGDTLRDAGFVYQLTGDTDYFTPTRAYLLAQAAEPGTDFSNTTKWPVTYVTQDKDFTIAVWLRKLTYAYSYIRADLSAADQAAIDGWLEEAGTYWALVLHNAAKLRFPNRLSDDYSVVSFTCAKPVGGSSAVTHFGGYAVDQFGFPWDNKRMAVAAAIAAIGATLNDPTLMADAKRYFQEWIRSNTFPDGTVWEQARWTTANPQSGYNYSYTVIGSASTIADHLARAGDTNLYTYSTSLGNCGSEGGPKSLLTILRRYANITLGNVTVYASLTSTADTTLLIDSSGPGGTLYNDVNLAQPNVFYQDPLLRQAYTRSMPASWDTGGYDGFGGDWGHLPAARFMFGQTEGRVWPFKPGRKRLGVRLACGVNEADPDAFTLITDSCASFGVCHATDSVMASDAFTMVPLDSDPMPLDDQIGIPGLFVESPADLDARMTIDPGMQTEIEWTLAFASTLSHEDVIRCEPRNQDGARLTSVAALPTMTINVSTLVAGSSYIGGRHVGGNR